MSNVSHRQLLAQLQGYHRRNFASCVAKGLSMCAGRQLLAQMVRYHMLPTPVNTANMTVGSELKTSLSGHKITITATSPQVGTSY